MRVLAGLFFATLLTAQPSQETIDSFEKVWRIVEERHWDPEYLKRLPDGRSWQDIHGEYSAKIRKAADDAEARTLITEMLRTLKQSHFALISDAPDEMAPRYQGDGAVGLDPILAGQSVLVRSVRPGGPAEKAGVQPGWEIVKIDGFDVPAAAQQVMARKTLREPSVLVRMLAVGRLSGRPGSPVQVVFRDGANVSHEKSITRAKPNGTVAQFGFLPPMIVDFETRRLRGDTGYVRFNIFLDPASLMGKFKDAVASCLDCRGFVIDLRGNPGGLAILASTMAGFFVEEPDTKLGTLYQRDLTLRLTVNPRLEMFRGPLAILVDESSVSTSEIMAGGLQDLKRARIFGTRTAGAALPSMVEQLPNGDLFQYAMANYISESGRTLEGHGVTPDVEIKTTKASLLNGKDPVLEAALDWIHAPKR